MYVCMYVRTILRMYVRSCVGMYVHIVCMYLCMHLPTYLPTGTFRGEVWGLALHPTMKPYEVATWGDDAVLRVFDLHTHR